MGEGKGTPRHPVAREAQRTGGEYNLRHPRQPPPVREADVPGPAPTGEVHPRQQRRTGRTGASGRAHGEEITPLTQFSDSLDRAAAHASTSSAPVSQPRKAVSPIPQLNGGYPRYIDFMRQRAQDCAGGRPDAQVYFQRSADGPQMVVRVPHAGERVFPSYFGLQPEFVAQHSDCLLYTSPSPRDGLLSRMPSSA